MHTTNLRKVGGSIMLSVPPAILEQLRLQAGSTVTLSLDGERLVIQSSPKPRYTLAELLASSDYSQPQTDSEQEWVDSAAVGRELI
jgi:antitoxin ChpS